MSFLVSSFLADNGTIMHLFDCAGSESPSTEKQRQQKLALQQRQAAEAAAAAAAYDHTDPIYQAMVAAAKAPIPARPVAAARSSAADAYKSAIHHFCCACLLLLSTCSLTLSCQLRGFSLLTC